MRILFFNFINSGEKLENDTENMFLFKRVSLNKMSFTICVGDGSF